MWMAVWAGICVAVFLACHPGKSRLEEALEAAGENRSELEQVLDHYRGDSLKSLAAQFLIENMPCHYAYAGKELEKYHRYFERFPPCAWRGPAFVRDSLLEVDGAFCPDSLYKVYDIHVIKSDYLIRNIDQAFEVWREQPWGRHVDFADFLEFILPYRVGTETLSDWRQEVYDRYNPMLDSIRASADSTDVLAVAQALMDSLSVGTVYFTGLFPSGITVGPDLVEWRSGNCRELTDLVTYVFRALGIPGGCDKMLMRGDKNVAHYWNFVVPERVLRARPQSTSSEHVLRAHPPSVYTFSACSLRARARSRLKSSTQSRSRGTPRGIFSRRCIPIPSSRTIRGLSGRIFTPSVRPRSIISVIIVIPSPFPTMRITVSSSTCDGRIFGLTPFARNAAPTSISNRP